MLTTATLGGLFASLLVAELVLWALFLKLGLLWAKVERVTKRRIIVATMTVYIATLGVSFAFLSLEHDQDEEQLLLIVIQWGLLVLLSSGIIQQVFKSGVWQALRAFLPTLISRVLMSCVAMFVFVPYVTEAFVITSSSMAPTLLGEHLRDVCPRCGALAFGPPDILDTRFHADGEGELICENFHIESGEDVNDAVQDPDHMIVAKYLKPRRWDLIVFRPPFDSDTQFVMRVVGLPGEEIVIKEGQVTADGHILSPPAELEGITYQSSMPGEGHWFDNLWGTEQDPAVLGTDEYFVLGDFTARSRDSRLWPENDSPRPSYALSASNIDGVVTHIYWPPSRWRILR